MDLALKLGTFTYMELAQPLHISMSETNTEVCTMIRVTSKRAKPFIIYLSIIVLAVFIGCGGGDDKEPEADLTDEQKAALVHFNESADAYKNSLLADPNDRSKDQAHADALMNTILMFMTADNGQSANNPGAQEYLIWYIKNYIIANSAQFARLPPATQAQLVGALTGLYNQNLNGLDPSLVALASIQINQVPQPTIPPQQVSTDPNLIQAPSNQLVNLNNVPNDQIIYDPLASATTP